MEKIKKIRRLEWCPGPESNLFVFNSLFLDSS